jgi:hypothetical protein
VSENEAKQNNVSPYETTSKSLSRYVRADNDRITGIRNIRGSGSKYLLSLKEWDE